MTHETVEKVGSAIGGIMLGSFLGMIAGIGIGLLIAPKSGRETREMLKEKAMEWRDKGSELVQRARGTMGKAREEASQEMTR